MGITYIEGRVKGPMGEETVRLLVDGGATYTVLPEDVWRGIELKPLREHEFTLADGTVVNRKVSESTFPYRRARQTIAHCSAP